MYLKKTNKQNKNRISICKIEKSDGIVNLKKGAEIG